MGGDGAGAAVARRFTPGDGTFELDDDRFWTQLECTYASAFGWTLAAIYEQLDLPTYLRHCEWWAENPPLHLVPRAFFNPDAEAPASSPRPPSRDRGQSSAPRPEHRRAAESANGNAGAFLQAFLAGGGRVQHVPHDYFARRVAELDRDSHYGRKGSRASQLAAQTWMATLQNRTAGPGR